MAQKTNPPAKKSTSGKKAKPPSVKKAAAAPKVKRSVASKFLAAPADQLYAACLNATRGILSKPPYGIPFGPNDTFAARWHLDRTSMLTLTIAVEGQLNSTLTAQGLRSVHLATAAGYGASPGSTVIAFVNGVYSQAKAQLS